jgi:hypothetical protein
MLNGIQEFVVPDFLMSYAKKLNVLTRRRCAVDAVIPEQGGQKLARADAA